MNTALAVYAVAATVAAVFAVRALLVLHSLLDEITEPAPGQAAGENGRTP